MSEKKPPKVVEMYCRIDMAQTLIKADDDTRMAYFVMTPDPRRYDKEKVDGKTFWRCKYTGFTFDTDVLEEMAKGMENVPMFAAPRNYDDGDQYSAERRDALTGEHESGIYTPPKESPRKSKKIEPSDQERDVTFLSVDVCGSTALRNEHGAKYDRALALMLRELTTGLGQFHGSVLKLTGDGFIGYFDGPSINTQCDGAADAAVSILCLMRDAVNPAGVAAGLPTLSIRIGVDFGKAQIRTYDFADVGIQETDVASDALNRAVKLQEAAERDSILIGRALYERIHVQWLERSTETPTLNGVGKHPYRAYRLR